MANRQPVEEQIEVAVGAEDTTQRSLAETIEYLLGWQREVKNDMGKSNFK